MKEWRILKLDTSPNSPTKCPICNNHSVKEYMPFCSKRCADIDLNRWLKGTYAIHTNEAPDDDGIIQDSES